MNYLIVAKLRVILSEFEVEVECFFYWYGIEGWLKKMFSKYYILFFFDQGLIVMICFFLFLFFVIIAGDGRSSSSQQGDNEARYKLSRPLSIRADALRAAIRYTNSHIDKNKKIAGSYGNALLDVTLRLGRATKKSLVINNIIKVQYACGTLVSSARYLESETYGYFTRSLFSSVSIVGHRSNREKLILL